MQKKSKINKNLFSKLLVEKFFILFIDHNLNL